MLEMIDFVRVGGIFSRQNLDLFADREGIRHSPLIKLARFEDSKIYLHDGHHRASAIWLGGRKELYAEEYFIVDWLYQDYLTINIKQRWYTVFDPRKEVRIPDISSFKSKVDKLLQRVPSPSEEEINKFIFDCYGERLYTEPRSAKSIAEMVESTHFSVLRNALVERG